MANFCRACSCFVRGPLATCTNCGREHDRDDPALEEPIRTRRLTARNAAFKSKRRRYR